MSEALPVPRQISLAQILRSAQPNSVKPTEAPQNPILAEHTDILIQQAQEAIIEFYNTQTVSPPDPTLPAALFERAASFVTLRHNNKLRGCIGSLQAHKPLIADVRANAAKSGFSDSRFSPLSVAEFAGLDLSISILSAPRPVEFSSRMDLLTRIHIGVDGLIITDGTHSAVYLPSVWEQLFTPELFLSQLMEKAGLPADHWSDNLQTYIFHADKTSAYPFPEIEQ